MAGEVVERTNDKRTMNKQLQAQGGEDEVDASRLE
jgi:hypothetical protein